MKSKVKYILTVGLAVVGFSMILLCQSFFHACEMGRLEGVEMVMNTKLKRTAEMLERQINTNLELIGENAENIYLLSIQKGGE